MTTISDSTNNSSSIRLTWWSNKFLKYYSQLSCAACKLIKLFFSHDKSFQSFQKKIYYFTFLNSDDLFINQAKLMGKIFTSPKENDDKLVKIILQYFLSNILIHCGHIGYHAKFLYLINSMCFMKTLKKNTHRRKFEDIGLEIFFFILSCQFWKHVFISQLTKESFKFFLNFLRSFGVDIILVR